MAVLVIFTMGLAIWHFAILVPDRFFGGMVGALIGSVIGSFVIGLTYQFAVGQGTDNADLMTVLISVPGSLIGMYFTYQIGVRRETAQS